MKSRKWEPLKSPPTASRWQFKGEISGLMCWVSPNGKVYGQNPKTGQWYKIVIVEQ